MANRRFRRSRLVVLGLLPPLLALAGCGGGSSSTGSGPAVDANCKPAHASLDTIQPGALTVNAYISPPYTIQNGPEIDGIDGMIVKDIASMECVNLVVNPTAGAALPASIDAKRADLAIGGVLYNDDRAASFSLTRTMYFDGLGILSTDGVNSVAALSNGTLGVIQGYAVNTELQKVLGTDHIKVYQTSASLVADIKNGRVQAGSFSSSEASYRAKQDPSLKAALLQPDPGIIESSKPSNVVLFLKKTSTQLTSALNDDINTLLANGKIGTALSSNGIDANMAAKSGS